MGEDYDDLEECWSLVRRPPEPRTPLTNEDKQSFIKAAVDTLDDVYTDDDPEYSDHPGNDLERSDPFLAAHGIFPTPEEVAAVQRAAGPNIDDEGNVVLYPGTVYVAGEPEFVGQMHPREEMPIVRSGIIRANRRALDTTFRQVTPEEIAAENSPENLARLRGMREREIRRDTNHSVRYLSPATTVFCSMSVLRELWGRPWNQGAYNFLAALRPSYVRIIGPSENVSTDGRQWRVTVHLTDDGQVIDRIFQEVAVSGVGFRDGEDALDYYHRREQQLMEPRDINPVLEDITPEIAALCLRHFGIPGLETSGFSIGAGPDETWVVRLPNTNAQVYGRLDSATRAVLLARGHWAPHSFEPWRVQARINALSLRAVEQAHTELPSASDEDVEDRAVAIMEDIAPSPIPFEVWSARQGGPGLSLNEAIEGLQSLGMQATVQTTDPPCITGLAYPSVRETLFMISRGTSERWVVLVPARELRGDFELLEEAVSFVIDTFPRSEQSGE